MEKNSKRKRELDRRRLVEAFAAGMTHDLNNIISPIVGYTELILTSENLPRDIQSNLEHLQEATRSACDFIQHISLVGGRGVEARCILIDICSIIRESLEVIKKSIPPNIDMQISVPETLDEVKIEPSLVHLLLTQLCRNAVQAMHDKGGVLGVTYQKALPGSEPRLEEFGQLKPFFKLSVSDTGIGIPADALQHIYDPYFTTRGRGEGKGLGLAIVKGIVSGCGGEILVDSEPDKGSCFHLCFPC